MRILSIIHIETSVGPFRLTLSENVDGTLVIERSGSEVPYGALIKIAELDPIGLDRRDGLQKLLKIALSDIEMFAGKIFDAHAIPNPPVKMEKRSTRTRH